MTTPGTLDCPEPENYAAVALQMQETALQVEQRLYAVERTLRAAANRQSIVQTSTAANTGFTTGNASQFGPGDVASVINFDNVDPTVVAVNSSLLVPVVGDGVYTFGVSVNLIASGAVTDNSFRIITMRQRRQLPGDLTPTTVFEYTNSVYEANVGGGMDVTLAGQFAMLAGDTVIWLFQHGNAGSTMNISSGARFWCTFLGSNETVEVF